jgi:outer membrane lipoprotein LolB
VNRRRLARWCWAPVFALLLAGCATPPHTAPAGVQSWSGRMALSVEGRGSDSFSAGFELKGAPEAGELTLTNPLGGTVAVLAWAPGAATLRANGQTREFASLDALAEEATGAPIPVASLFDWLAGKPTPVPGWEPDLSQLAQGRLRARRTDPPPPADLRLVLER